MEWWLEYLPSFDGISLIWLQDNCNIDNFFAVDTCMVGGGAICGNEYFRHKFDKFTLVKVSHISQLKMFTLCLAVKMWTHKMVGKYVKIEMDNQATMFALNRGKTKDTFMLKCLREIAWYSGKYQFLVKAKYIPTSKNLIPDLLSRWYKEPEAKGKFKSITKGKGLTRKIIFTKLTNFCNTW